MTGWTLLVATHAFAAVVALPLGAWQLFRSAKGSRPHRRVGYVWVVAMLYVSVTSFWIREINEGSFSFLHVLSVVTLITVSLGLRAARRGSVEAHRQNMRGSWFGLLGAFTFAVAVPDRTIPTFVVTEPAGAALAAGAVLATTALVLILGSLGGAGRDVADAPRPAAEPGRPTVGSEG